MTVVEIDARPARAGLRLATSQLAPKVLSVGPSNARIGLVAVTALLLGGDAVEIEVRVGAGATLDIVEMAGTVAYNARGEGSSWSVRAEVAEGGSLRWHGEPFVVSAGANVLRRSSIRLAEGARAMLRETVVLGRSGEIGGSLTTRTRVELAGRPLLAEDLDLADPVSRGRVGVLGVPQGPPHRVLDSVLLLGGRAPAEALTGLRFDLDGPGTLARWTGAELAASPIPGIWQRWSTG